MHDGIIRFRTYLNQLLQMANKGKKKGRQNSKNTEYIENNVTKNFSQLLKYLLLVKYLKLEHISFQQILLGEA